MDYRVTDTELTAVADAIRAKAESQDALTWPNGFAAKVASISGISAADEGKVVQNGALVAQTSRSITENGTYDTTTNDEVVVDVTATGGPIMGTDAPDASVGEDGDYYYRVQSSGDALYSTSGSTYSMGGSANKTGGFWFRPASDTKIVGAKVYAASDRTYIALLDSEGNVLAERDNYPTTAKAWQNVYFDSPVDVQDTEEYFIGYSNVGNTSDKAISYISGRTYNRGTTYNRMVYVSGANGSASYRDPAVASVKSSSDNTTYTVFPLEFVSNIPNVVVAQYFKRSGEWTKLV